MPTAGLTPCACGCLPDPNDCFSSKDIAMSLLNSYKRPLKSLNGAWQSHMYIKSRGPRVIRAHVHCHPSHQLADGWNKKLEAPTGKTANDFAALASRFLLPAIAALGSTASSLNVFFFLLFVCRHFTKPFSLFCSAPMQCTVEWWYGSLIERWVTWRDGDGAASVCVARLQQRLQF